MRSQVNCIGKASLQKKACERTAICARGVLTVSLTQLVTPGGDTFPQGQGGLGLMDPPPPRGQMTGKFSSVFSLFLSGLWVGRWVDPLQPRKKIKKNDKKMTKKQTNKQIEQTKSINQSINQIKKT